MDNIKQCKECQGEVPQAAIKCMHCCSDLVKKSRMVTFFLNLLIPGLGYVNQKKVTKGIVVFIVTAIAYGMLFIPGLFVHAAVLIDSLVND